MKPLHVAFILESENGHVNPSLGIAAGLVEHGYRVSYAVRDKFAASVRAHGAEPLCYCPLDYRMSITPKSEASERDGSLDGVGSTRHWNELLQREVTEYEQVEIDVALPQLENLYLSDTPDLIIYDCRNLAGRILATKWGIPKIEHSPLMVGGQEEVTLEHSYDENLVIVSIPKFFQRHVDSLDTRFQFIGPLFCEKDIAQPWKHCSGAEPIVLVSGPTAGIPSLDRFELAIEAFKGLPYRIILSVGDRLDPSLLGHLPENFSVNQFSSHLELLRHANLFVGHGGQASTLEAMYRGVPMLILPPEGPLYDGIRPLYDSIALRVTELGLGRYLRGSDVAPEKLARSTEFLLNDADTLRRAKAAQRMMIDNNSPGPAAQLIAGYLERARAPRVA